MNDRGHAWRRYGVAVASVVLATLVRMQLDPLLDDRIPSATYFLAVFVSAWYGGLGPALLALVSGAVAADYYFIPPQGSLAITGMSELVGLVVYFFVGIASALLSESLRTARGRAEAAAREAAAQREWFRVTLAGIGDAVIATDGQGRVTFLNAVAEQATGWSQAEAAGRPLDEVFPIINEQTRAPVESPVARVLQTGRIVGLANHTLLIARDGRTLPIDDSAAPLRDDDGRVLGVVLVFRDVTARKRAERRLAAQHAATRTLAEAASLAEAAPKVLQEICTALAWDLGALWTVDREAGVLRCEELWHAGAFSQFEAASRGHTFSPGIGLPGRIWADGRPSWIADVVRDDNFPRAPLAASEGLHAAIGVPIILEGEVLGVIECFSHAIEPPDDDLLEMLGGIGAQIGQFLERRRAEAQLLRNEQELADFFDNAAVGLHWVGPDGKVLRVNQAELDLLGYTREEYIGHPIAEFHADAPVIADILQRLQAGETLCDYEARLRCKDGTIRHVLIDSNVLWEEGRFYHTRCFTRDITERKRIEADLQQSEARFQAFMDHSPVMAFIKDDQGRYVYGNAAWRRRLEAAGTGPPAQTDTELWPEELVRQLREADQAALAGERVEREIQLEPAGAGDGDGSAWMALKFPLEDPAGRRLLGCIAIDITERKRSEAAMRRREEQLRLAQEVAGMGTWDWDIRTGRIEWSDNLGPLHGLAPGAFAGTYEAFLELIQPEDRAFVMQAVRRAVEEGSGYDVEFRILWPDGSVHWVNGQGRVFRGPDGRGARMIGVGLDITGRKRAERELIRAKEAAEAASRAKDQFLAVLSHELRTPLTPVLAEVTGMLDDPATPATVLSALEMIGRNVGLEARLIDDLLDITRISRGKLTLHREVVDAHGLVLQALEICRADLQAGGLAVERDLAAGAHHVEADPARLQQVFWNLIKNAVKFSPAGGTLSLRSRNDPAGGRLIVEVADTGIGIEPELLPRLFNAFEQGEASITRRFGGLGLGLAISRSVAELHGGSLTASSPGKGRGAVFTLVLATVPAPAASRPGPLRDAEVPSPHRPLRVLYVEDNEDTARILSRLLGRSGHVVTTAHCLASALEVAATADFDLVISDLGLPDGSGLELMRSLRRRTGIRGIALSGFGREDDLRQSREAGFSAHLIKPIDFRRLEMTIRQVATAVDEGGPPTLLRYTPPPDRPRK